MNTSIEKVKFTDCSPAVKKEVLDNMRFVKWDEKRDGHRNKIIVKFKNGQFYGYGLV
jgi:hypothetical protein